jgi:hypothetical protein
MQVRLVRKVFEGHVKHVWPLLGEHVIQVAEQSAHEELELFEGLIWFPVQLMHVPLLKKVLIGQEMQIVLLFDEHTAQMREQTIHEEFEFPYGLN